MSFTINDYKYEKTIFPDGTMKLNLIEDSPETPEYPLSANIHWHFENEGELIELMYIVNHIRKLFHNRSITLILDYLPQARMDRVYKDDEVFTLKYICNFINSLNIDHIYLLDPHSDVSMALLNNVDAFYNEDKTKDLIKKLNIGTLIFPDNGAFKKYSKIYEYIIKDYNLNIAYGEKIRDWETGKIKGIKLVSEKDLSNQNILVIDDICSRGGTFMGIYKSIVDNYKTLKQVYLLISHCEETIKEGSVLDYYDKVYTFNYLGKKDSEPIDLEIISNPFS